jgi:hypothetical protein
MRDRRLDQRLIREYPVAVSSLGMNRKLMDYCREVDKALPPDRSEPSNDPDVSVMADRPCFADPPGTDLPWLGLRLAAL